LAAAISALNMYAVSRHSKGATRNNVVKLHAGSGRNIIPHHATLKVVTRGETSSINDDVKKKVEAIVKGAAHMYQNDVNIEVVGEGKSGMCSIELAEVLHDCARAHPFFEASELESYEKMGSEDATFFMEEVQRNGGLA